MWWIKRKEMTEEHKRGISEGLRKHFAIHDGTFKGRHHSEETKRLMSAIHKKKYREIMKARANKNKGPRSPSKVGR